MFQVPLEMSLSVKVWTRVAVLGLMLIYNNDENAGQLKFPEDVVPTQGPQATLLGQPEKNVIMFHRKIIKILVCLDACGQVYSIIN